MYHQSDDHLRKRYPLNSAQKLITFLYVCQTVSTVHFILGILRTDLWSQGTLL